MCAAHAVGDKGAVGQKDNWSVALVDIPSPDRVLLLTERPGFSDNHVLNTAYSNVTFPKREMLSEQKDLNPGGKFNFLFADGHVEALLIEDTIGSGSVDAPQGMWLINGD